MATARDELQEVTNEPVAPTIREALAELGRDPVKYGEILDASGPDFMWEKTYKTDDPLELGALTLLTAARQSGAEPEEYLSRLAPYFDSKIVYNPLGGGALGYVEFDTPDTATATGLSRLKNRMGTTVPHELEHTLQMTRKDDPGFSQVTSFSNSVVDGDLTKRFGTWDERYDDLQEALQALPEEKRQEIVDDHPVFGGYMNQGTELMARLRAREMLDAAKGHDFYQSEMGQALFPTEDMRAYMVGSTLPGVASATPPWSFERTDETPTSVEDQRKSYARRIMEMLPKFQDGGEVSDQELQPGYLRFPESARGSRATTSAQDLQQLGTQAGLIGLGFAPGAGMADYLGYFPSPEGGTEPSAVQNWQQGNYGTAAMQGLGAMGDLMYAVPFLGATVGSAMKGPRVAQRMLGELPKIDELGFYSQTEKALTDIPQQKGTGQQFLAQLQKTPGVKQEELQYTGLADFLANKPNVTKAEIQDFLDTNRVQLQEVQLGGYADLQEQAFDVIERAGYQVSTVGDEVMFLDPRTNRFVEPEEFPPELQQRISSMMESRPTVQGEPKFSKYTLPGGTNYREMLLKLPVEPREGATLKQTDSGRWRVTYRDGESSLFRTEQEARDALGGSSVFQSSHFEQPNILAHMRVNDRVVDGKPTLFVEEIQSDWHQAGRKKGYGPQTETTYEAYYTTPSGNRVSLGFGATQEEAQAAVDPGWKGVVDIKVDSQTRTISEGVPDAPFKTSWHELTLKKALNEAATKGYDQIAFTTGKTQAERYDLSKQISSLQYNKPDSKSANKFGTVLKAFDKDGNQVINQTVAPNELSDYVGKEVAEKLMNTEADNFGVQKLSGVDLSVGGEGMKGFYDNIVPKSLNKIGKKYGTSVRKTTMDTPDGEVEVWAMDIPPEMRETISTQGQPLFQIGAGAAGAGTAGIMGLASGEAEAANEDNRPRQSTSD